MNCGIEISILKTKNMEVLRSDFSVLCFKGKQIQHSMVITDCRVMYNGRNGLSWGGGYGLTISNSEFSYTGQSRIASKPSAGIDIEFETVIPNAHGVFRNVLIKYNKSFGVICDADRFGFDLWCFDYRFRFCKIISPPTGDCLWPNSRNFTFESCQLYGTTRWAYDARVSNPSLALTNHDNIKFYNSTFNEEYFDPDPNIQLVSVTSGIDENISQPSCISNHPFLIDYGFTTRLFMKSCNVTTNFTSKLILLSISSGLAAFSTFNRNELYGCNFYNYGLNTCDCVTHPDAVDLTAIYHTKLLSPVTCQSVSGLRNEPNGVGCGGLNNYLNTIDAATCTNIISNWWVWNQLLQSSSYTIPPKLNLPPDPHLVSDLFWCSPCPFRISPSYPVCEPPTNFKIGIENKNKGFALNIYPNPTSAKISIENLVNDQKIIISNSIGSIIQEIRVTGSVLDLDFKSFSPGLYFVKIGSNSYKIIKQ